MAVEIGELDRFLANPSGDHGTIVGELRHRGFPGATMLRGGTFRFDGDRAVYSGSFAAGGRSFELHASRVRRPSAALDVSIAADGEPATTVRLCPSPRQVAAQVQSLHARNTGNLLEGARVVTRFSRALLAG